MAYAELQDTQIVWCLVETPASEAISDRLLERPWIYLNHSVFAGRATCHVDRNSRACNRPSLLILDDTTDGSRRFDCERELLWQSNRFVLSQVPIRPDRHKTISLHCDCQPRRVSFGKFKLRK